MIEAARVEIPEGKCKECQNFKDIKNPVFGWCMMYKTDVHPEWVVRCSSYEPKN